MRRFTVAPDRIRDGRVVFDHDEPHHRARVLRVDPGEVVIVADGHGREYTVRVDAVQDPATGTVVRQGVSAVESPLAITLVQGVAKGDKVEQIVRAATELGLRDVQPVITARTVVRLEPSRWRERARRWQRVAKEAAKQSGRAVVPDVHAPRPLADWLAGARPPDVRALRLCLWEGERRSLGEVIRDVAPAPSAAEVLVGPEGGLAPDEVDAARALGFVTVGLGPRILRCETAGPAVVAILQFQFGDLAARAPVR
jgi:16S rRNA (uracil1498-N3)-methyltransferase